MLSRHIGSFCNPDSHPVRQVLISHVTDEETGVQKLSKLSKMTQLARYQSRFPMRLPDAPLTRGPHRDTTRHDTAQHDTTRLCSQHCRRGQTESRFRTQRSVTWCEHTQFCSSCLAGPRGGCGPRSGSSTQTWAPGTHPRPVLVAGPQARYFISLVSVSSPGEQQ